MTTKNPRWMHLIDQLLASPANNQRSDRDNVTMLAIMEPIIRNLIDGVALSDKQSAALINNIRFRVPGRQDFTFDGVIKLTKEQRRGLRNRAKSRIETTPDPQFNTETTPKPHLNHTEITPKPHRNNTETTPEDPSSPYGIRGFDRSTILNSTGLNSTLEENHSLDARGSELSCASALGNPSEEEIIDLSHSLIARDPNQKLEMIAEFDSPSENPNEKDIHEIFGDLGLALTTTPEEIQRDRELGSEIELALGDEQVRLAARESALEGLRALGDRAVPSAAAKPVDAPLRASVGIHKGARLSLWFDGRSSCAGEVKLGSGLVGYFNFQSMLVAEGYLGRVDRDGGDIAFGKQVYQEYVKPHEQAGYRTGTFERRFAGSPVYRDRYHETGIHHQAFAILIWNEQSIEGVCIMDGPNEFIVPLQINPSKSKTAPAYKGVVQEA